ncbi:uncharacterized protein [Epargyreus clarus]|uniref:uncharacterized protein n=1 Tax=Epargyreus clarus TaxID=520877 RepID=UPI003C2EC81C
MEKKETCKKKKPRHSLSLKRKSNLDEVIEDKDELCMKPKFNPSSLSLKRRKRTNEEKVSKIKEDFNPDQPPTKNEENPKTTVKTENNNVVFNNDLQEVAISVSRNASEIVNVNTTEGTACDSPEFDFSNEESKTKVSPTLDGRLSPLQDDLDCVIVNENHSIVSLSSATEIGDPSLDDTMIYEKPHFSLSFSLTDCKNVNVTTKNINMKKMLVSHNKNDTSVDCEVVENSQEFDIDTLSPTPPNTPKKHAVSINLEIKKKNLSTSEDYQSKVLILNTNAIEKLSHVIVQPPHYKSIRRKIQGKSKILSGGKRKSVIGSDKNGNISVHGYKLSQNRIDNYFAYTKDSSGLGTANKKEQSVELRDNVESCDNEVLGHDDMSKTVRADTARSDGIGRLSRRVSREENGLPRSSKMPHRDPMSQIRQDIKTSNSEAPKSLSPRYKNESVSSCSPRRNLDSLHFHLPCKTKSNKTAVAPRDIPHYKIVAGTHFAVDAFCYGEIPGVKNYFLTHFHSDHYSGLKKSFNKILFCSQITADLCTSRLGVNAKFIRIINVDEPLEVDGVKVTAIDANHCPGAVMLIFTLPNDKTLLHTGDFRATPLMESHPVFWNNDIHTIYLDTTYCNPRYDFPTQDQSLEMALHVLRQKKMALEKIGKKFGSVLIVCGTYTIGKEKFFLGMAKRVGCNVWACPEKDKVLQTVEGRSFSHAAPRACQLHVVPMRDLTHEKLRSYLDSLQGAFSEVVAFKPSGWENGKNTPVTKDMVTIHGIPYSEHSSFSEMIRFVNFLKPKQVVPTVDISGGVKAVQKYFPCPLVYKEDIQCQSKLTDFFNVQSRHPVPAVS